MKQILISLICLIFVSSCSLLSPQKTPDISTYTLSSHNRVYHATTHKLKEITLIVNTPTAVTGYDSRKMIYSKKRYELNHFALNQWAAPPAEMIHPILVQKLRDTGRFNAVMSNEYNSNPQFVLRVHLIELQQNFAVQPSQVQLKIQAEILTTQDNKVIRAQTFITSIIAPQNTPYGGVLAANKAVDYVLNQITEFTLHSLNPEPSPNNYKTNVKYIKERAEKSRGA